MRKVVLTPSGVVSLSLLIGTLFLAMVPAPAFAVATCEGQSCDDGNVCTRDVCDPVTHLCSYSAPPDCDDHNVCTTDTCTGPNPGDCAHTTPPNCDDNNVCTIDTCTGPSEGDCSHKGTCDDGDPCTLDECVGPPDYCRHSAPMNCDDGNICTTDVCLGPNPGDCSHSAPDCDDHNVCTTDTCTGPNPGDCAHTTPPNCDDGNVCTLDICTGPGPSDCSHSLPFSCDDYPPPSDPCWYEICGFSDCSRLPWVNCDDGNICTIDSCTGPNPGDCSHSNPPNCDDHNVCTTDTCTGPNPGDCAHSTPPNCDDGNICTIDRCAGPNLGDCEHRTVFCDDGNPCTEDPCSPDGYCLHSLPPNCDDGNVCTIDSCTGPGPTDCSHSTPPDCDDHNVCTTDTCTGPNPGDCAHSTPPDCDDQDVCTDDACTGPSPSNCSHAPSSLSQTCGTSDACVDRGCDPAGGCFEHDHSSECGASETCVARGCDPTTGCFERDPAPLPPECEEPQPGCRVSAGGASQDGEAGFADSVSNHFGGLVEAPCGCNGCSDDFEQVRGRWETSRRTRQGSFHASDFNSLICGCDGVLDGKVCDQGNGTSGTNVACFSGIGSFNPTNGKREIRVAFRIEVEDRDGSSSGKGAPNDSYRIRIWIPVDAEIAEGLAAQVCCAHAAPAGRDPDIDDKGGLIHGNIQVEPPPPGAGKTTCLCGQY